MDIVKDNHDDYLVEPSNAEQLADKILYLLSDEKKKLELSNNSRDSVREYGWNKVAEEYLQVYERALMAKKKSAKVVNIYLIDKHELMDLNVLVIISA